MNIFNLRWKPCITLFILILISKQSVSGELDLQVYSGKMIPQSNSAILTSDTATLVIDAQFLRPDGQALLAKVEATGKPLTAVLITHEHPDHVWGAVELLKRYPDAKVYARPIVRDDIGYYFRARLLRWTDDFTAHIPTSLFDIHPLEGDSFDFDGHEIQIIDQKPNEMVHSTGYYIPELKTYVAGDQIFHNFHSYITGGLNYPELWIESLDAVRNNYDIDVIVPGHGPMDDGDLIFNKMTGYLKEYISVYKPLLKQSVIVRHMLEKYPDYALKEILFMTVGPAVTSPDLIEMMHGNIGFAEDH